MKAFVAIIVVLACSFVVFAQVSAPSGSIVGTIQDESGALIPGVTVTAAGPRGSVSVVSNAMGSYTLANLSVGTYVVTASLPGFSNTRFTDLEVGSGATFRLTLTMRVQGQMPKNSPRDRNFNIVANSQTIQGPTILYRGNVRMVTDSMQLTADELDFDSRTLAGDARGNVKVHMSSVTARVIPLSGER